VQNVLALSLLTTVSMRSMLSIVLDESSTEFSCSLHKSNSNEDRNDKLEIVVEQKLDESFLFFECETRQNVE
jgi:hypothetical protein